MLPAYFLLPMYFSSFELKYPFKVLNVVSGVIKNVIILNKSRKTRGGMNRNNRNEYD